VLDFFTKFTLPIWMDTTLKTWVGDNFAKFQGFTEDTVTEFIIASAKRAKSEHQLLQSLQENCNLPDSDEAGHFVSALYNKFPRKSEPVKDTKKQEVMELLERNAQYTMLEPKEKKRKREKEKVVELESVAKGKSFRKRDADDKAKAWEVLDASEDELSEPEIPPEDYESERERDLRERDELDKRIRERDFLEKSSSQQIPKKDKIEITKDQLPSLRERSRQEYLKHRERERLIRLKQEIEDEERLFGSERRTKKEIKELERKKKVLQLAMEMEGTKGTYEGYQMPDDYITEKGKIDSRKKEALLYQRYDNKKSEKDALISEQQKWEESKVLQANVRFQKLWQDLV
jgi:pre-mRNA-splicing factor ATP-dependent RNA helicase DHX16